MEDKKNNAARSDFKSTSVWKSYCRWCGTAHADADHSACAQFALAQSVERVEANTRDLKWLAFLTWAFMAGGLLALLVWSR